VLTIRERRKSRREREITREPGRKGSDREARK